MNKMMLCIVMYYYVLLCIIMHCYALITLIDYSIYIYVYR
jgi:hypothetical protein